SDLDVRPRLEAADLELPLRVRVPRDERSRPLPGREVLESGPADARQAEGAHLDGAHRLPGGVDDATGQAQSRRAEAQRDALALRLEGRTTGEEARLRR